MYTPTGSNEVIERVEHIRRLLRQFRPRDEPERLTYERRERRLKDLITNLRRANSRAMVQTLDDLEAECLLTKGGAYRLFGYELDAIREYDLFLNGGRTHIVESYIFERDLLVELPLELAPANTFTRNGLLSTLVRKWQSDLPLRVLDRLGWRHPGTFYVHIGTEDSLGSSLPPGATALVEPIGEDEARRPNPLVTYLLQFRNGYRCSRCVATGSRLHLLTTDRSYRGPEQYLYPGAVRIAGRIRGFALELPSPEFASLRGVWTYPGNAELILPWEHDSRWKLLATKRKRFVRSPEEQLRVETLLGTKLHANLSDRTRRRYRRDTASEPHADALIQMSVEHFARYSDLLRSGGRGLHDSNRFSLEAMLKANRLADLAGIRAEARAPTPAEVWEDRRRELGEYSALFALKFPKPSVLADHVIRLAKDTEIPGLEPRIKAGSWMALDKIQAIPDTETDARKRGWARPLYAWYRGVDTVLGYLDRAGSSFHLLPQHGSHITPMTFDYGELSDLWRVSGVLVPM